MTPKTRATGFERLSDLAIRTWWKSGQSGSLHDGGGLYLRRREGWRVLGTSTSQPADWRSYMGGSLPWRALPHCDVGERQTQGSGGQVAPSRRADRHRS